MVCILLGKLCKLQPGPKLQEKINFEVQFTVVGGAGMKMEASGLQIVTESYNKS